jgi:hypothetical protein
VASGVAVPMEDAVEEAALLHMYEATRDPTCVKEGAQATTQDAPNARYASSMATPPIGAGIGLLKILFLSNATLLLLPRAHTRLIQTGMQTRELPIISQAN